MKTNHLFRILMSLGLTSLAVGCGAAGAGNANGALDGSDTPIAAQVNARLGVYAPKNSIAGLERAFYSLKAICADVGGDFDTLSQECLCNSRGGLFTTGTDESGCARLTAGNTDIYLVNPSGIYQQPNAPEARIAINADEFLPLSHVGELNQVVDHWRDIQGRSNSKPFRLSFYGYGALDVQNSPDLLELELNITVGSSEKEKAPYQEIEGVPFSKYGVNYPMYEPDLKYLATALGQSDQSLSVEDQNRFSSLTEPQDYAHDADRDVGQALLAAYQSFKLTSGFRPATVNSPYESGCASYCVASEPLRLGDSTYFASYKKVYQLGTPSSRLIVLQDAKNSNVVGVLSLNVSETVSTLTIVNTKSGSDTAQALGGIPFYFFSTYDRYGNALYMGNAAQKNSPFENLVKGSQS